MKARRTNPFRDKIANRGYERYADWKDGYQAAGFNKELEQRENHYQHGECLDCTHVNKHQYNLKVMFTIEDPVGTYSLTSKMLAEQLADALPKEWWQDSNVAEWGTVAIYPLDEDGMLRKV
jgi:hypothetical protein